jgi:hypothetical protein
VVGHYACTWAAQMLPTVPTAEPSIGAVIGTDGRRTFAGYSGEHAVLWRDGRLIDLGQGVAADVNRSGDAVGAQSDSSFTNHATLFRAGTAIRLAEPVNAGETRATGINDAGLIVGTGVIWGETMGASHALVWSAGTPGTVTDLGTLDGDQNNGTTLVGVNEQGTLIGNVFNAETGTHAGVTGTVSTGLRALPAGTPGANVIVSGIAGRYIAGYQYAGGGIEPVRWVDGKAEVLPGNAETSGVNSHGTVVGRQYDLGIGLIWTGSSDPVELPIPSGEQTGATAITDHGIVAGYSIMNAFQLQPVLWSCL